MQRSLSAKGILKRNYISTVRHTIHTNPTGKLSFSKTLAPHDSLVISMTDFSANTNSDINTDGASVVSIHFIVL